MEQEPISGTYRAAMLITTPFVKWWGRMRVSGVEALPTGGPTLVVGNHDSYWDPVAVGIAARRRRQIRALAKSSLWDVKPLAPVLDGMGQIPIKRGQGDAAALSSAIEQLGAGACIGIFPEGTRALGKELRARSGVGRLALEVPEAVLVCVAIRGTSEVAKLGRRPRVELEFFLPESGQTRPDEEPGEIAARLLAECRGRAPVPAAVA